MLVTLIIVGMVLLVTCAALWPEPEESGSTPTATAAPEPEPPTTLEGTLTSQLLSGKINKRQYRAEQARLAARDAERHPLALPDDRL
ncbi:hypothetical protein Q0Z83_051480 [Actinoplanes sichuanensis]|uniref:SHOCT domain-containing protein n=1 Tax=Actinoplanes sichuanensis TaxID=512349 RepID=A0ABW4ADH9_9ACTN|nr:hypothetical protein [Actinoplanes sichuanensis]BEL06957.1 hypothetical protein Q0Z83_051480 [Actinoplanes sichuanensis]